MDIIQVFDRFNFAIHARDIDALMALIAEDAEFIVVDGKIFRGKDEIRNIESKYFALGRAVPRLLRLVHDDRSVFYEIEIRTGTGETRYLMIAMDVNSEGLVSGIRVYRRPLPPAR